jgi:hypothetical protein
VTAAAVPARRTRLAIWLTAAALLSGVLAAAGLHGKNS